jgi:hypothetical protein
LPDGLDSDAMTLRNRISGLHFGSHVTATCALIIGSVIDIAPQVRRIHSTGFILSAIRRRITHSRCVSRNQLSRAIFSHACKYLLTVFVCVRSTRGAVRGRRDAWTGDRAARQ